MNIKLIACGLLASVAFVPASAANLLVNGGFEASTSQTATPTGWTNVGHSDGVIAYSLFGTPAYDGDYFYDLGGFGNAFGPVGDGIAQTVATVIGQAYTLTFGLTSENANSTSELTVFVGGSSWVYPLATDAQGVFKKPFATIVLNYVATSASTTISFIETANASGGNNDPLIDGVIFDGAVGTVPEPASWAMMIGGLALVGASMRGRKAVVSFA